MKIGVLMGGPSPESEISIMSGEAVAKSLIRQGFEVFKIYLDNNLPFKLRELNVDIVFVALHGVPGEDGTVQGLLEIMGIPYTGPGVIACSISIDKILTKKVLESSGIIVPKYYHNENINIEEVKEKLCCSRWMVKWRLSGSSIGVELVDKEEELLPTFQRIKEKYGDAFIEEYIPGKDITVGVLVDEVLPVLELVPKRSFFDYEAKYTHGLTDFILPARLPERIYREAQEIAMEVHKLTLCEGFSRTDMKFDGEKIYVLEINSIPGLTEISALPAEANYAGISYDEVVYRILEAACKKYKIKL